MLAYIIRRLGYAIPILIGVNLLTFALFFVVNTPDQMAQVQLGDKHITPEAVQEWKAQRGYDKPLLFNPDKSGLSSVTDTIFYEKSLRLFALDFGKSDAGRSIAADIEQRMWPSLAVALPTFVIGISVNIAFALFIVMFRASIFDTSAMILCVALMSISGGF
jgi:peptide/nickel transport system permease protein